MKNAAAAVYDGHGPVWCGLHKMMKLPQDVSEDLKLVSITLSWNAKFGGRRVLLMWVILASVSKHFK